MWSKEDIEYMSRILFWRHKRGNVLQLSIGAPSSPLLSNILLYNFDLKVSGYCSERGITYTRYADDLSFSTSTPEILREVEGQVAEICRQTRPPRLVLNEAKTVHASKKGLRRVTGLVLANDGLVSIGRDRKREIRAAVHSYLRGMLNEKEAAELGGMLAFIKSVEPMFLQRLARTYGAAALDRLLSRHRHLDSE